MRFIRPVMTLALIMAIAYALVRPKGGPNVGGQAPPIVASSLDGSAFNLSDHRGQVVVLDFWATWCRPCRKSLPALNAIHHLYAEDRRVHFASINVDKGPDRVAKVRAFMKRLDLGFPVVLDQEDAIARSYGVRTIPTLIIVDSQGRIHSVVQGLVSADKQAFIEAVQKKIRSAAARS
ncbi:MAG: TlpA disulfide reductase family protein [Myxococcota bacterium]|nr:TlpA disulfide reductase family protein [Myxococcota bacterium]